MAERIELSRVSLSYRTAEREVLAVDDVSFTVAPSEFFCVLGPSGCGKTTIMNMIAGFLRPTSGEILIGGARLDGKAHDRGVVFQDFAQLFPWRTARRNVEFGLEVRDVPSEERRKIALQYLRLVRLEKFSDAYPHQLSGGMQQRVAIARALAYNPGVLLMDEPFAALDAMTREEMQRLVTEIWQQTKKTVVYVTHNVAEAVYLADKVLVLDAHPGKVKVELTLDLPRPRDSLSTPFVEAQRRIMTALVMH
jgi:NitT/TauT family transport system ATP-binding protein